MTYCAELQHNISRLALRSDILAAGRSVSLVANREGLE